MKSGDNGKREEWDLQPALLKKFASKGHAEDLPFQLSPTRGLLIDDAFRRQQAVADKALFPKGSEEDRFETRSVRLSRR